MSQVTKGYISALIGIAVWSTTGIFIGYLINVYRMPPLQLALWRNVLVCVGLFPVLWVVRRSLLWIDRAQIGFFLWYGLLLAVFNAIWTVSVQTNGAAVATVLGYSAAGFTVVLAWWLFGETLGLPKLVAVALSLGGCVLVANAYNPQMWNLNPVAIVTGLLSGLLFAGYNLFQKVAANRRISPWTSLLYSFAFASVFLLLFNSLAALLDHGSLINALAPDLPISGWLTLMILSFIPTILGFGFYNLSMNFLPASTVSLLATLEPVMTAVEAYVVLGERMTPIQVFGSGMILMAVVLLRFE